MRLDQLRLFHIHPQNFHWIGFAFAEFDLNTVPAAANDEF